MCQSEINFYVADIIGSFFRTGELRSFFNLDTQTIVQTIGEYSTAKPETETTGGGPPGRLQRVGVRIVKERSQ